MRIVVINKDKLENIPPLISVVYHLTGLGHEVHLITTGYGDKMARVFQRKKIEATIIPESGRKGFLSKLMEYLRYHNRAKHELEHLSFDALWIEGGNTVLALGSCIKRYRYILHISELYEKSPVILKALSKVIHSAEAVVLPEYNRASLYQVWFSLNERPFVLPNIPAFLPDASELEGLELKYSEQLGSIRGKTVILYQGHIGGGRDLSSFAKAVQELGDGYVLLLVGKDYGVLDDLRKLCDRICHIDFIQAPDYLLFTKQADIGILSYDPTSENNIFCAPNKLFEYASYGVPMIGNDIPGLKYMIEPFKAGIIIDESQVDSIKRAILKIERNLEEYSKNSRKLYDSFDNMAVVSQILNRINSSIK